MVDEVEVDLERLVPARDQRCRESPRRHEESRIPPVIHEGCQRQANLPDDLSPHMDRVQRVLPVRIGERRPWLRHGHAEFKRSLVFEPPAAWAMRADWMPSGLKGGVACAFGLAR